MAKIKSNGSLGNNTLKKDNSIGVMVYIAGMLLLIVAGLLLKDDFSYVMSWEVVTLIMTIFSRPAISLLFPNMADEGWLFVRALSILICGYVVWLMCSTPIFSFSHEFCVVITAIICGLCFFFGKKYRKSHQIQKHIDYNLVVKEEIMFFMAFALWSYFVGFQPQAYGTEKFMDYGLMANIYRSEHFPTVDMWYSNGTTNYYYLGQYFSTYLAKITYTEIRIVYNMMRAFVAAFAFVLPYSLISTMLLKRFGNVKKAVCHAGGVVAGVLMNFAGNLHYLFYGIIPYILAKISGESPKTYWYPDATRYIGYFPENQDKCIHEFPSYSFVEGDLHAHVINIMFVLALLGVLYAFTCVVRENRQLTMKEMFKYPHIYVIGFMLGVFKGSNYWDFVIYFTLCSIVIFFTYLSVLEANVVKALYTAAASVAVIFVLGVIVILPFTLNFVSMEQGVALCEDHSLIYQLLVLWGLPAFTVVLLIISSILNYKYEDGYKGKLGLKGRLVDFFKNINTMDYFIVILGVSAIALVILPEIVYVVDIYSEGYKRANTMFKLTYQAFILFCMTSAYAMFNVFMKKRSTVLTAFMVVLSIFHLTTTFYGPEAFKDWFENVFDMSKREGLDGLYYLEYNEDVIDDRDGIKWLNSNVKGMHVLLEADGDSYTAYERVTAMTGLATPLGWHTHEHLWRNDEEDTNAKSDDVRSMFTSYDENEVKRLLDEYAVEYIFVGAREREKYGDSLNNDLLKSLGEVVFTDENSGTYIVKR